MKNKLIYGLIGSGKSTYVRFELLELVKSDCSWLYDIEVLASTNEYDRLDRLGLENVKVTEVSGDKTETVLEFLRAYKERILRQPERVINNLVIDYFDPTDEILEGIFEMMHEVPDRVNVTLVCPWREPLHNYEERFRSMGFVLQGMGAFYKKVTKALKEERIRSLIG